MTTITTIILTVIAMYAAGIIALYIGHRMDHAPFHPSAFDIVILAPLANILWFLIIGRLCHWTENDIVGNDPYNQKMIQPKIDRLLLKCDDMFKV